MANCSPETPCSPPQSPSSAIDLDQESQSSATTTSTLTIPESTTAGKPPVTTDDDNHNDDDALSAVTDNEATIALKNVHVRIQKRPNQLKESEEIEYESVILPTMTLPEKPTLDSIRDALLNCELGRPERDIFFPTWTKSLYISWQHPADPSTISEPSAPSQPDSATPTTPAVVAPIFSDPDTIDTDLALQAAIAREQASPGTLCLLLQECRNARYSRKRDKRGAAKSRTHSPQPVYNTNMFYSQAPMAFPVYAEAGAGKSCGDGTVYFDGPLTFGYPLHPGYGCTPVHSGAVGYAPEYTYVPPFAVMPFMYAPHNAQH